MFIHQDTYPLVDDQLDLFLFFQGEFKWRKNILKEIKFERLHLLIVAQ